MVSVRIQPLNVNSLHESDPAPRALLQSDCDRRERFARRGFCPAVVPQKMTEVEKRYADLVDHLPVGVYRNTPGDDGRFLEANPELVAMFEADSREQLLECRVNDLYVHPGQRKVFCERILRHGFVREHELELKTLKGRRLLAEVNATLKRDPGGEFYIDGVIADVTERKRAEADLRRACAELARSQKALKATMRQLLASRDQLEQAQLGLIQAARFESVATLAAGVAHEVKNPLQIIMMGVDYLDANLPPESGDLVAVVGDIREAARRANAIIREILELSVAAQLDRREADMNAVVERSLALVYYEAQAARVQVVRDLAPSLPLVLIDTVKIEQVLINLFLNSLQAMAQGGRLTVSTRVERAREPVPGLGASTVGEGGEHQFVAVEVRDNGPGIPRELLPKVFDPFFSTKPVGVGTGLGLAVVRKIIDLHEATIELANEAEGGVRVAMRFRARSPTTPVMPVPDAPKRQRAAIRPASRKAAIPEVR